MMKRPMQLRSLVLAFSAVVALAAGPVGCSSSSANANGDGGVDGPVSFAADVMPIFQQSCTQSQVCHGQMNMALVEKLYLGESSPTVDPATAKSVYDEIVGVPSLEDPSMDLIAAGDAGASYLVHKLNGDQNMFSAECAKAGMCGSPECTMQTPCGASMPYEAEMLSAANLQQITDWIDQGAKNN